MDKPCVPETQRVGRKRSFGNAVRNATKKRRTLWILALVVVLLSVLTLQNYTVNQYARAVLKLAVMQVSQQQSCKE